MQSSNVHLRESIEVLEHALTVDGYSHGAVDRHVNDLVTYASMCRVKTDAQPGAYRDFAARACTMVRRARLVSDFAFADAIVFNAACEALHDLIMEGV